MKMQLEIMLFLFQLKKDLLFRYLHDKRVEGVEATADKAVMVSHVLQLWESSPTSTADGIMTVNQEEDSLPEAPAPSRNTSYSSLCALDLYHGTGKNPSSSNGPPSLALILNRSHSSSSSNLHDENSASHFLAPSSSGAAALRGSSSSLLALKRSESNLSFMDDHENSCDGLTMTAGPGGGTTTAIVVNGETGVQGSNGLGEWTHNSCSFQFVLPSQI